MLVSSENKLLNILIPNDNKVLKEVFKNADVQTLESLKKGNASIKDILNNLFTDLKTSNKNNANIENILKNSNVFKELGDFSKSITTLLKQIDSDDSLAKYKPLLQSFTKDIKTLDDKVFKDLINKSGIFLEAKALEQIKRQTALPKNLENILTQIKTILNTIPTLEAKKIETLIDNFLQNNKKTTKNILPTQENKNVNDLKTLVSQLQNLSKTLSDKNLTNLITLTNSLKTISNQAQLVESKINNNIFNQNSQASEQIKTQQENIKQNNVQERQNSGQTQNLKQTLTQQISTFNIQEATQKTANNILENLNQLKNEILINKDILNKQNIIKQIDTLIQAKESFFKPETITQTKNILSQLTNLPELKNASITNSNISDLLSNIKNQIQIPTQAIQEAKQNINIKTFETLTQLKNELLTKQNIPNTQNIVKQIDTLLKSNDLFSKNNNQIDTKVLLKQLTDLPEMKIALNQNSNISTLVNNLKNQSETINTLENKVLQNQNILKEKIQLTNDIKQTLTILKTELSTIQNIDSKGINQLIDKLLNIQNLFTKIELPPDMKNLQQNLLNNTTSLNNFQSNFSSNINNLILTLKENIINFSSDQNNLNLQQNILKTVDKLETILNNIIQNPNLLTDKPLSQNPIQNDMKAVLLQMQDELINKTDVSSQETLKQIDKMVTQVEYHQLLSLVSNSNNVYIPFLWDMLDEGSIAMKKVDEEKFYCEINLSLKEFGQTQLLLALYDKNKLDLTIYASKDSFKQTMRENLTKLKQALNSVNLIPVNIKIIDLKHEEKKKENIQANVYNQDLNLGFGVDIRI